MGKESDAIKWLKETITKDTTLGKEYRMAEVIERILDDADIPWERVPLDENPEERYSLVATLKGCKPGKVLGFAGHMDVVPLGDKEWTVPPFGADEIKGKIYGRGSSDMKGGLMASVAAMVNIKKNNIPFEGTIKVFATAGEESGLLGSKILTDKGYADDVDAMIVGEPTLGIVFHSHKGVLRIKITADINLPAGEEPKPGQNAINYLLRYLEKYDEEFKLSDFLEGQPSRLNPPTISINMIGNDINVGKFEEIRMDTEKETDQTHWETVLEVRTVPELNQTALLEKLEQLMRDTEKEIPGLTMSLEIFVDNAPVSTSGNNDFVKLVTEVNGVRYSSPVDLPGCTDASEFIRLRKPSLNGEQENLPIVIFARANMLRAHKTDEFIYTVDYTDCIKVYEEIIKKYLQPTSEK